MSKLSLPPIRDIYRAYCDDPTKVDDSFGAMFDGIEGARITTGPAPSDEIIDPYRAALVLGRVIEAYRWRGHLQARLDPLGLVRPAVDAELALDRDLLAIADAAIAAPLAGELGLAKGMMSEALKRLEQLYCGSIGFEYMHVRDPVAREWLRRAIETEAFQPDTASRRDAAEQLIEADEFELFMQRRFVGKKRFGAEGAESLLCVLWAVLKHVAASDVRTIIMGGTSRARLNQIANFVGKPLPAIFAEVGGAPPFPEGCRGSGDVPYHLGFSGERTVGDTVVRIDYCANPSHLETIDGVAMGRVRAIQDRRGGVGRSEAMTILVHTDAAFAGQGVVAETAQMGGLADYDIGGSVHVVINNQVGFTTDPSQGRTSAHCTDLAAAVGTPVFHVNADDVEAVIRVGVIAAEYRQRFRRDAIIDLVCYRRRGHNELDEPTFTQPGMYRRIAEHPTTRRLYLDRLIGEGVVDAAEEKKLAQAFQAKLDDAYKAAGSYRPNASPASNRAKPPDHFSDETSGEEPMTGVPLADLADIGRAISSVPPGLRINPKVERVFAERHAMLDAAEGISWAFAEGLAIGSLVHEGTAVRMSGQDTPRGAFSQRHFTVHDQDDGRPVSVFDGLAPEVACRVFGSPLAEYGPLGFEYGYSLEAERSLVIWEAQFGDFANVAQPIFDQFIVSGEDKWLQQSALVTLLPHGLEGQGAEHSSGRIERVLQMCATGNIAVVNASTPANYFHALRRQVHGPRRPLVLFTPKSLLRHRQAVSSLAEMGANTRFKPVIGPAAGAYERLVLCSGKAFWEIEGERIRAKLDNVGVVRIEQLYPFPARELRAVLAQAPGAQVTWFQEEPRNMGAWSFFDRQIERVLREVGSEAHWPSYVGRPANPSPAMGTSEQHAADQATLIRKALFGEGHR